MITLKELDLSGAYKAQNFAVPFFVEEGGMHLVFDVALKNTYVQGYTLNLMFEDDVDEEIFDGVEPTGFFTKTELKEFEKVIFGNEVKEEIFKQKKSLYGK